MALAGASTLLVATAGPASAAPDTLLYRSTENVRVTVSGRACTPVDPPWADSELTSWLYQGERRFGNQRSFRCGSGATRQLVHVSEWFGWESNGFADAYHAVQVFDQRPATGQNQYCSPVPIEVDSRQFGYVTGEFTEVSTSVSTSRYIQCPFSGMVRMTFSVVESWSAVTG